MTLKLLDVEETYLRTLERLSNGWIVISGDANAIMRLEYEVYPPGTRKNADFELTVLPGPLMRSLFLGKKTLELRSWLKLNKDPELWGSLIWVVLSIDGSMLKADSRHFPTDMPEINRSMFFEELARELIYGHEGGMQR